MSAENPDWPIRTIGRGRMVESLLAKHFGLNHKATPRADALAEIEVTLDRWLAMGLGVATDASGKQRFDPVEVFNFFISAGRSGRDPFWEKHFVETSRGDLMIMMGQDPLSQECPAPSTIGIRRYSISLNRTYYHPGANPDTSLRLRLPLPIENPHLKNLDMQLRAPGSARLRIEPGRLVARLDATPPDPVTLGVTAAFDASPDAGWPGPLGDEETELYLKPRENFIYADDRLYNLARAATARQQDHWSQAQALFRYMIDRFTFAAMPYHIINPGDPLGWSLQTGILDCQIGAAMFCALCRSLNIPARVVSGYELYSSQNSLHYWAQVWTQDRGWRSFDFAVWVLSNGGSDPAWRDLFCESLDHRMIVEVMPLQFTGPSSVRLPRAWHLLRRQTSQGFETTFYDAQTGQPVYADSLTINKNEALPE